MTRAILISILASLIKNVVYYEKDKITDHIELRKDGEIADSISYDEMKMNLFAAFYNTKDNTIYNDLNALK